MCIGFLSKCLKLPRSAIEIIGGHTSRMKRILLRLVPGSTFPEQAESCKKALVSLLDNSVSQGSVTRKKTACLPDRFQSIMHSFDAGWSSLVARRAHNPKVVGSNPAPATKK
jgi:hypothetical protein